MRRRVGKRDQMAWKASRKRKKEIVGRRKYTPQVLARSHLLSSKIRAFNHPVANSESEAPFKAWDWEHVSCIRCVPLKKMGHTVIHLEGNWGWLYLPAKSELCKKSKISPPSESICHIMCSMDLNSSAHQLWTRRVIQRYHRQAQSNYTRVEANSRDRWNFACCYCYSSS